MCVTLRDLALLQGSELSGWALGRYSYEGIDMNHNFPDLDNIMWDSQYMATDKSKVSNHYIPIPDYYTKEDAFVSEAVMFFLQALFVCLFESKCRLLV